jgi:hypothetical protein
MEDSMIEPFIVNNDSNRNSVFYFDIFCVV